MTAGNYGDTRGGHPVWPACFLKRCGSCGAHCKMLGSAETTDGRIINDVCERCAARISGVSAS